MIQIYNEDDLYNNICSLSLSGDVYNNNKFEYGKIKNIDVYLLFSLNLSNRIVFP